MSTADNPPGKIPVQMTTCTSCERGLGQYEVDTAGRCPECAAQHRAVPVPTADGTAVHEEPVKLATTCKTCKRVVYVSDVDADGNCFYCYSKTAN